MTGTEWWWLGLAIAGVVVVVVAVLLGLIIAAARSIDRHAYKIWLEGKKIAGNTVAIWILEKTDRQVRGLAGSAERLEETAAAIDQRLRGLEPGTAGGPAARRP